MSEPDNADANRARIILVPISGFGMLRRMELTEVLNRKTLLRLMLAALALTAVSAVAAVVLPGALPGWRVAVTAIVTAFACLMLMPTLTLLNAERTRPAGLFGLLWVGFMALVGVTAAWADLLWRGLSESLLVLVGWTFLCGLPVLPVLVHRQPGPDDLGVRVLVGGAAIAWVILAVHAFMPWRSTGESVGITGVAVLGACVLLCACLAGVQNQRSVPWRWVGVLATIAATLMALYGMWFGSSNNAWPLVLAYAIAACIGYANIIRRAKIPTWASWVRWLGVTFAGLTGLLLTMSEAEGGIFEGSDLINRLTIGSMIILGATSAAVFILAILHTRVSGKDLPAGTFTHIQLACPRCGKNQSMPIGQSACEGCRLRIALRVQLPICTKCEYDLSSVRGEKCPECGEPIALGML